MPTTLWWPCRPLGGSRSTHRPFTSFPRFPVQAWTRPRGQSPGALVTLAIAIVTHIHTVTLRCCNLMHSPRLLSCNQMHGNKHTHTLLHFSHEKIHTHTQTQCYIFFIKRAPGFREEVIRDQTSRGMARTT